jgi:hypothetical protein
MEVKNIKEAKALVKRYREITAEEIENAGYSPSKLTGFGSLASCTLCQAVDMVSPWDSSPCLYCIYTDSENTGFYNDLFCNNGVNKDTYNAIEEALDAEELLMAYQERADHIENLLKTLEK